MTALWQLCRQPVRHSCTHTTHGPYALWSYPPPLGAEMLPKPIRSAGPCAFWAHPSSAEWGLWLLGIGLEAALAVGQEGLEAARSRPTNAGLGTGSCLQSEPQRPRCKVGYHSHITVLFEGYRRMKVKVLLQAGPAATDHTQWWTIQLTSNRFPFLSPWVLQALWNLNFACSPPNPSPCVPPRLSLLRTWHSMALLTLLILPG